MLTCWREQVPQSTFVSWIHSCAARRTQKSDLGRFPLGVRVGPGEMMPRLPALYPPVDEDASAETAWRRNCASTGELTNKVVDVMEDQGSRGQLIKLSEAEAQALFPNLVVASIGTNLKDKLRGVVT